MLAERDPFHAYRGAFRRQAQIARQEKLILQILRRLSLVLYADRPPAGSRMLDGSPEHGHRRRKRHETHAPTAVYILQALPQVGRENVALDERVAQYGDPHRTVLRHIEQGPVETIHGGNLAAEILDRHPVRRRFRTSFPLGGRLRSGAQRIFRRRRYGLGGHGSGIGRRRQRSLLPGGNRRFRRRDEGLFRPEGLCGLLGLLFGLDGPALGEERGIEIEVALVRLRSVFVADDIRQNIDFLDFHPAHPEAVYARHTEQNHDDDRGEQENLSRIIFVFVHCFRANCCEVNKFVRSYSKSAPQNIENRRQAPATVP